MLKELKEKCEQQLKELGNCYGCPCQDRCAAFRDLRTLLVGYDQAHPQPWALTDHYVERFDELIAKMGGDENAGT